MSDRFVFIGDIVEKNGKTIRQNNLAKPHNIPKGTLVEIGGDPDSGADEFYGIRLFVTGHGRDCDGTPLYSLGVREEVYTHGWSEDSLRPCARVANDLGDAK